MVEPVGSGSSLETAAGAAGPHAIEAFALLGNKTRLAILLALWERYDPHSDDNAVPFSTVYDRVDCDDSGNLRYHLKQLEGPFIGQRAEGEGYELRVPGIKLVQAIIAGAGVHDVTREATEIEQTCPFCGSPTAVSYREGLVFHACTECDGVTPDRTNVDGFLSAVKFEPAGLADRSAEQLLTASRVAALRQTQSLFDGICPTCSGPVESWLDICPEHDAAGVCDACGSKFPAWARFRCHVCKDHGNMSPKALALLHPTTVAFYADHGLSTRVRADDTASSSRGLALLDAHEMELTSTDPPRVAVTASVDDDKLCLTFDERARVVDVRR